MPILLKNVFRLDCLGSVDSSISHITPQRTYTELHEKVVPTGITQEYAVVEYPHTPERIKSFADIADYKKDPYASIMNGAKQNKQNLGDIRDLQRFQNMDKTERKMYLQKIIDVVDSLQVIDDIVDDKQEVDEQKGGEE